MSTHHFYTLHDKQETHVVTGWDEEKQGFILNIDKCHDLRSPFFTHRYMEDAYPDHLTFYLVLLQSLGIHPPMYLWQEVYEDKVFHVKNKQVIHMVRHNRYRRREGIRPPENLAIAYRQYGSFDNGFGQIGVKSQ